MGRCIYSGVYDPGNPNSDCNGFRTDVLDALRDLNIPVMRYPGKELSCYWHCACLCMSPLTGTLIGGNFCATYHWQDGVGPRHLRPARPELAWLGLESNQFGTDEFMQWLDVLSEGREKRVEPYLCLNMGTGTLDEALAWVEYCNGTRDTHYANLRRKNGHPEPYKVKYWALGNEVWGPWQVEQLTKEDYAKKAFQWAKALRLLDPSISLVLCGETGPTSWDHYVLHECVNIVEMHSIHIYTASKDHYANVTGPLSAERAIQTAASLIDIARIEAGSAKSTSLNDGDKLQQRPIPKICFDEWNVWDPLRATGDKGAEESYDLSDALAVGVFLNVFVRQARYMGMANLAQSVNVISPLMTSKAGIYKQTTWWPLYLFSRYMRGTMIGTHVRSDSYMGQTSPEWLQPTLEFGAPLLDVSAAVNDDGIASMVVVNISDSEDLETVLEGIGGNVQVYEVTGPNIRSKNVEGKEDVSLKEWEWDAGEQHRKVKFVFKKHSLTMMRWKCGL